MTELSVISYNVRVDTTQDGAYGWAARREAVTALLRERGAALIGLQEALAHQRDDLVHGLEGYEAVGVGRDDGATTGEFNPILYQTGRLRLCRQETFWLSETPDVPGSMSWGAGYPRIVTWSEFEAAGGGRRLFLFNTHLDHQSERAREEGARLLRARMAAIAGSRPAVVTGDFNCESGSRPLQILVAPGADGLALQDAQNVAGEGHAGPAGTLTSNFREPLGPKIDFILVTAGVEVLRHAVLDEKAGDRFPSDHLPVLAEIRLRDQEGAGSQGANSSWLL